MVLVLLPISTFGKNNPLNVGDQNICVSFTGILWFGLPLVQLVRILKFLNLFFFFYTFLRECFDFSILFVVTLIRIFSVAERTLRTPITVCKVSSSRKVCPWPEICGKTSHVPCSFLKQERLRKMATFRYILAAT